MSKIRILPEILSNKIAAGEVVERPASVVKELVENALDAQSTRITIEIEQGGRALIRVSDNGSGMNRDDALLAIERYATSKIYSDQDLFSISTLGFRGEALPSIAAVSRFAIITRAEAAETGTEITIEGGKLRNVTEIGAPPGTVISVKQLFFNTPARRKFLKSLGTEMGHIADTVSRIALAHPGVHFRLRHNAKTVKDWISASDPFDRIADVLGRDLRNELHAIDLDLEGLSIQGWISSPAVTRKTSRGIHIYVNGRFIRDRTVQHALFAGYTQRLVKGQYPVAVIFIRVPFDAVDVNVHPTKNEVRFARQREVHAAVKRAVAQKLYDVDRPAWGSGRIPGGPGRVMERPLKNFEFAYRRPAAADRGSMPEVVAGAGVHFPVTRNELSENSLRQPVTGGQEPVGSHQQSIWPSNGFSSLRVIGQLHNTYIVCEGDDGLLLIDQHAAHERIFYERLCRRASADRTPSQTLLAPQTVALGFREAEALETICPDLKSYGLDVEPFGGNTFVVKAVPAVLATRDVTPLVVEIAEHLVVDGAATDLAQALDSCLKIMACHGAIRARQVLTAAELNGLLQQLDRCDNPSHCPHGRPTWVRWDLKTLEKKFKRIV